VGCEPRDVFKGLVHEHFFLPFGKNTTKGLTTVVHRPMKLTRQGLLWSDCSDYVQKKTSFQLSGPVNQVVIMFFSGPAASLQLFTKLNFLLFSPFRCDL
jgi:hypothetical protein